MAAGLAANVLLRQGSYEGTHVTTKFFPDSPGSGGAAGAAAAPSPGTGERDQRRTILVVEDDDNLRALEVDLLTADGYRVLSAKDGEAALKIAKKELGTIDLVLTDWVIPRISGVDFACKLRSLRPNIRILVATGRFKLGEVEGRLSFPLIQKPFTVDGLLATVRAVLARERHKKSILVVAGDSRQRRTYAEAFQCGGADVFEAVNGKEALKRIAQGDVDLVIMDLAMHDMDGREMLRLLRRQKAPVRVVAVVDPGEASAIGSAQSGADRILTKPVDPDSLRETARELICGDGG